MLKNDESISRLHDVTYSLRTNDIWDMKRRCARRRVVLNSLFNDPWEAEYYVGWRGKMRRFRLRISEVFRI